MQEKLNDLFIVVRHSPSGHFSCLSDASFEAKIDSIFLVMEFFLEHHRTFCTLKIPKTTFYTKNREHFRLSDYSDRNKVTSLIASFVVIYLIQKQIRN
jgi:hypothetical protein